MAQFDHLDEIVDWTDYDELKETAKEIGRSVANLLALSSSNDPFTKNGERTRRAEWLAKLWRELSIPSAVHIRRVHYILVSHKNIPWPKGGCYENTELHWKELTWAARDAMPVAGG